MNVARVHLRRKEKRASTPIIHSVRGVLSFALLGAVLAGALFGWADLSFDPRAVGAIGGFIGAIIAKLA